MTRIRHQGPSPLLRPQQEQSRQEQPLQEKIGQEALQHEQPPQKRFGQEPLDTILGLHRGALPKTIRSQFLPQDLMLFQHGVAAPDDSQHLDELEAKSPAGILEGDDAFEASIITSRCNECDMDRIGLAALHLVVTFMLWMLSSLLFGAKQIPVPSFLIAPMIMWIYPVSFSRIGNYHYHFIPLVAAGVSRFLPVAWKTSGENAWFNVEGLVEVWKMKHVNSRVEPNIYRLDNPEHPFEPLRAHSSHIRSGRLIVRLEEVPLLFKSTWCCFGWLNVVHDVYWDWQRLEAAWKLAPEIYRLGLSEGSQVLGEPVEYSVKELDDAGKGFTFFPVD
ncbi:hypothetical protein B0T14DRAFT_500168 [Immersiella caudata]|uniref:Uncharacterized protein n=1 Tax=Immersiella caudata TaxID=314043 RepID=A0AA39T1E4_9PEZI|nr:hypothetical protein B0T14DRAFT_500168 [Immersiella caudata]